jgi:hypothetical protein
VKGNWKLEGDGRNRLWVLWDAEERVRLDHLTYDQDALQYKNSRGRLVGRKFEDACETCEASMGKKSRQG